MFYISWKRKKLLEILIQCNSDKRELSGPEKKSIFGFLLYPDLVYFVTLTQALILEQWKISLITGVSYIRVTLYKYSNQK